MISDSTVLTSRRRLHCYNGETPYQAAVKFSLLIFLFSKIATEVALVDKSHLSAIGPEAVKASSCMTFY
jgi:hypothetical protein